MDDFLADFLAEFKTLEQNGISCHGKIISVALKAFVCDAPARSFLKCTKGHTAFHGCERCTIVGRRVDSRTVLYTKEDHTLRTNDDFASLRYTEHQIQISPLVRCGFSCVTGFTLDYMHLICLGVVKRMLSFLRSGPRLCKLSTSQWRAVSDRLVNLSGKMPSEFARQPRTLDEVERWKATEFRQFILYSGAVVLKGIVSTAVYEAFLALRVYARQLLRYFVDRSRDAFGEVFVVYNVHNVMHLADDVQNFHCSLNSLSAFPFENKLRLLKRYSFRT